MSIGLGKEIIMYPIPDRLTIFFLEFGPDPDRDNRSEPYVTSIFRSGKVKRKG